MFMCAFLFGLWLLLNGRVTPEICLIGLGVTAAVYAFCMAALGFHPKHEKGILRRLGLYIAYFFLLIWEILKANFAVMRIILINSAPYHAGIVRVKVPLKRDISRVILANSITLTPGTVTVEQRGEDFLVLCLQKDDAHHIPHWRLTRLLHKLEDTPWN